MNFLDWIKSLLLRPMLQDKPPEADAIVPADKVENFVDMRLRGQEPPKDLGTLLAAIVRDPEFEKSGNNPLNIIGAEILWTDREYPLLDHSYINDMDLADPSIMANVKAMQDTDKKMRFVVQCEDTSLIGYWQAGQDTPLEQCALFWLDTEGQYHLTEGQTLSESLAYRALIDECESTYHSLLNAFERLGVSIPKTDETSIFCDMDRRAAMIVESPQEFRNQRYEYYISAQ